MKVFHVIGKELEKAEKKGDNYQFLDGDVYVVDNNDEIFVWIGRDCSVDEQTVGAWVANKIDNQDRGGEPSVYTVLQGEESDDFKKLLDYTVRDGDNPGFLVHAELDMVEYKLYRIYTKEETVAFDEAFVEEVTLDRSSLKPEDVYMLDGNEHIFLWLGSKSNREEKIEGQKFMQKVDADRHFLPIQYTIYEGEGGKSEQAFYDFLEKVKDSGPVVSVEDQRELGYKPQGKKENTIPDKEEKKGFFAWLKGLFS